MCSNKPTSNALIVSIVSQLELPETIVLDLFRKFISNARAIIEQINTHHDDLPQLKIAIHSLKGISKNFYLDPLGDACEKLEADLPSLSPDQQAKRLESIVLEIEKTIHLMQETLK